MNYYILTTSWKEILWSMHLFLKVNRTENIILDWSHCEAWKPLRRVWLNPSSVFFGSSSCSHVVCVYRSPLTICPSPSFCFTTALSADWHSKHSSESGILLSDSRGEHPWQRRGSAPSGSQIKGIDRTAGEAQGEPHLESATGSKLVNRRQSDFTKTPTRGEE